MIAISMIYKKEKKAKINCVAHHVSITYILKIILKFQCIKLRTINQIANSTTKSLKIVDPMKKNEPNFFCKFNFKFCRINYYTNGV